MNKIDMKNILLENEKLKKENDELKKENNELKSIIKELNNNINFIQEDHISKELDSKIDYETFDEEKLTREFNGNKEDMSIISFLARSNKRVDILKSLEETPKIPSIIAKEIGDSSHHVSKYLTSLKEKELVICLNEEDKRFRFYRITAKGKHYLEIIENKKY